MDQSKIDRINELARKAKSGQALSEEELEERAALRTEYLRDFRANMTGILDSTVVVRPDGTREKLSDQKSENKKSN